MTMVRSMITELREKHLWPVALALLVALVAVPLFLSKSTTPGPLAPLMPSATGPAPSLPAVSVTATPSNARLTGKHRNPFHQQVKASSSTTVPGGSSSTGHGSTATVSAGGTTTTASTGSGSTSTGSTGSTSTGTGSSSASGKTPTESAHPAPLTGTESYQVALSITTSRGGVEPLNPERLAVLPSAQDPRLIELGVLEGTDKVLFAVEPGTVLHGRGACTPGAIQCQIVSLSPGQIETISKRTSSGTTEVAQMAVTGVSIEHATAAATRKLRRRESSAGRRLLRQSTLAAVSLFQYQASAGAVLDMRNLTVGGN
jgi:hypothetical protein